MFQDHHDDLCSRVQKQAPMLCKAQHVKTASWVEKPSLHDREFAVILVEPDGTKHRKFAMQDAGNTTLSIYYLLEGQPDPNHPATKLAAHNLYEAAYYQKPELLQTKAGEKLASLAQGVHEADGIIDGRHVRYDPAPPRATQVVKKASEPNPYEIVKEASYNWEKVDPYDRRQLALKLANMIESVGGSLPPKIAKYAGEALSPLFDTFMEQRARNTAHEESAHSYRELAKLASFMPISNVVETIFLIDEQCGNLTKYASKGFPDPVLCVFHAPIHKQAQEYRWDRFGDSVTGTKLASFSRSPSMPQIFAGLFHEHQKYASAFRREPVEFFQVLPEEQQSIIARLASGV